MSWERYLSSVTVPFALPIAFGVDTSEGGEIVYVEVTVKDSTSDEMIKVKTRRPVQPLALLTDREAADVIRDLVRVAVLHEIDEAITIEGKRVFDPHARLRVAFQRDLESIPSK